MSAHSQQGFTLIELMISLVIGLILMGSVLGVAVSGIQSAQANLELQDAQDSFRFTSATLLRIVRNASAVSSESTDASLKVSYTASSETPDCLGNTANGTVTNTFTLSDDRLLCNNGTSEIELARDISALSFSYGTANADGWVSAYSSAAGITDWDSVSSVKTTIATTTGFSTLFTTTLRQAVLQQYNLPED